jgi:hypothetical protein
MPEMGARGAYFLGNFGPSLLLFDPGMFVFFKLTRYPFLMKEI